MNREEMLRLADAEMQRAQEFLEAQHAYEMAILKAIRQIYKPKGVVSQEEVYLRDLRPGAVFVTREDIYAVKSKYFYANSVQCECVLLASGEYAQFRDGDETLVREVSVEGFSKEEQE